MKAFLKKCPLVTLILVVAAVTGIVLAVECAAAQKSGFLANSAPQNSSGPDFQLITGASSAPVAPSSKTGSKIPAAPAASYLTGAQSSGKTQSVSSQQPAAQTVGKSYFNDALFVGDSLTEGMKLYGGLDGANYFCRVGLNIYQLFEQPKTDSSTGLTLEQTLFRHQYGKIYILLGINELGTGNTTYFVQHYSDVIEKIRKMQPNATIYVQSILYVTAEKMQDDPVFSNDTIRNRNDGLKTLTDGSRVFYVDVASAAEDGHGNLPEDYSGDGVHLKAKYYSVWVNCLMQNAR